MTLVKTKNLLMLVKTNQRYFDFSIYFVPIMVLYFIFIFTSLSGISLDNELSCPVIIAVKYVQQRATFASLYPPKIKLIL